MQALVNGTVHTATEALEGHAVLVEDGRILDIVAGAKVPAEAAVTDLAGGALAPGFIDIQVNGGGGVLFNDLPTPQTIARIAAAHRRFGTTGFLPTLMTDSRNRMKQAIAAVRAAIDDGMPGVLGIHLEGPHLNAAKAGVHEKAHIRPPGRGDADLLASLGIGRTVVTLAPECVAGEFVRALVARGVRVCAGHTEATQDALLAALADGVTGFTHLFNAMGQLGSREPGAVGTALSHSDAWCGIIVDGHHVHYASVGIAWRAKPRGKLMLVSDAMPPVGAGARGFSLGGQRIEVRDGRCVTADGRLAGSALEMASAVRNCTRHVGIPLDEALRMASTYAADFLGLSDELGRIAPGYRANLALLDADLVVRATWIDGRMETYAAA